MSDTVISAENLSKKYFIGLQRERYATLRDMIVAKASVPFRRARNSPIDGPSKEFWALKDVCFEVKQGEVIGIIGRNGAGKSTLLKILSRITEPTRGRVRLRGRVASLLEVGTGFHPELTGRENVFLNGAILGMSREEIKRKFDEIVAFAEIEKFIDTPVKRYSSGMFVRLAFAIAAHLEPEILIVDEVLAVGDYDFQRRCLGKMNQVAHSGRTILFVSHNMTAVEELCPRSLLLKNGQVEKSGSTNEVIGTYLSSTAASTVWDIDEEAEREGTGNARITRLELLDSEVDVPIANLKFRQSFRLRIHYRAGKRLPDPRFGFAFLSDRAERVFQTETSEVNFRIQAIEEKHGRYDCLVVGPNLLPGVYLLEAWIIEQSNVAFADHIYSAGRVEVVVDPEQEELMTYLTYPRRGKVLMDCRWSEVEVEHPEGAYGR